MNKSELLGLTPPEVSELDPDSYRARHIYLLGEVVVTVAKMVTAGEVVCTGTVPDRACGACGACRLFRLLEKLNR